MEEDIQKFDLKLNEDNDLAFGLSIDGATSDPNQASPNFRFTVMEAGVGTRGWIFPAVKEDNDVVHVRIPTPLKEGFSANKTYQGKLEVIVGSLYFSPAEMMLEFSAPLTIKAKVLNKAAGSNPINKITATVISNKPLAQKSTAMATAPTLPKKPAVPIMEEEVDLNDSELAEILSVIREHKQLPQNTAVVAPRDVIQRRAAKPVPMPIATAKPIVEAPGIPVQTRQTTKSTLDLRSAQTSKVPRQNYGPVSALRPKSHEPTLQEKEAFKSKFMNLFREALAEVRK